MSDELGYGLIVYSWQRNISWRITHSYFMPDPLAGDYNIGGLNFQWGEEGIFGLSLSPIASDGYRTLFFHPLSSYREFAVSTRILRDQQLSQNSYHDFQVFFPSSIFLRISYLALISIRFLSKFSVLLLRNFTHILIILSKNYFRKKYL